MFTQQIKFRFEDSDDTSTFGGILIDSKYIICGCCGSVFDLSDNDDITILEIYDGWANFSNFITEE